MEYTSLLTLDLNEIDNKERGDIYYLLEEKEWKKIPNVDTTWRKESSINNQKNEDEIVKNITNKLKEEVEELFFNKNIYTFYAVIQTGRSSGYISF